MEEISCVLGLTYWFYLSLLLFLVRTALPVYFVGLLIILDSANALGVGRHVSPFSRLLASGRHRGVLVRQGADGASAR